MMMLTAGAACSTGAVTTALTGEMPSDASCGRDVVNVRSIFCFGVSVVLAERQNEFSAALLRISMEGLRRFKRILVITPAPGMKPGSEAQISSIQYLLRKIRGPQEFKGLFHYPLL